MEGISEQEARQRLERFGPNELKDSTTRGLPSIVRAALSEPMVLLLLGIGVLYFLLGELEEVLSLLSFLILILSITVFQDRKTEKTLSLLKKLSSPRAFVLRDGKKKRIPGREVVPGDFVFLSEGDRVPADIKLMKGGPLLLDESIISGEAFPVEKMTIPDKNKIIGGTLVNKGQGWGEVISTGENTEIGKIGKSLEGNDKELTPLQRKTRQTVNKLGMIAAGLTIFVILFYGLTHQKWLEAVLVGLTLAMAILPNELPAVLLIFLAAGAWRISRRQVLTRKIPAVEALGGISVLCVDKTGTLTQNKMIISSFWSKGKELDLTRPMNGDLPENFHEILEFGILASRPEPVDPMERAFHQAGQLFLERTEHLHPEWTLTKEYALSDELLAVSYAWKMKHQSCYSIGAKGAPEAIIDLCHLSTTDAQIILKQIKKMADKGQRILAVARAFSSSLPPIQHDLDFEFMGLVGLTDPVRSDARQAVEECQRAGINVIMITGDHPDTAKNIGEQVGLDYTQEALTGADIDEMSDEKLQQKLKQVRIFCRMNPLHKHRIVKALKNAGDAVAMTGDGVNDALALKSADIGIAMGERGTDVAREASSIVLLDDNFSSIVAGIRIGRRTFQNLQNAFSYLLSIHIPITAVSILPVVFKLPLVLLPVHIAFLHLVIEPASTFVYEADPGDEKLMNRPPKKRDDPIISKEALLESLIQGSWIALIILGIFFFSLSSGYSSSDARGLTFTSLIFANFAFIYASQLKKNSDKSRRVVSILALGTFSLLALVFYNSFFRELFRFEILHPLDLMICLLAGLACFLGHLLIKKTLRR